VERGNKNITFEKFYLEIPFSRNVNIQRREGYL